MTCGIRGWPAGDPAERFTEREGAHNGCGPHLMFPDEFDHAANHLFQCHSRPSFLRTGAQSTGPALEASCSPGNATLPR